MKKGVSWHFLSSTTSSSSLGCSSSGTGTYLCTNTCVPIANLRGFNRTTGKNQNKHTGGEKSDGDHGVWVRQALQVPQGMLPQNIPVCNVHPTSQLIPPAFWNMADVPNTPFQNLQFTFYVKIYRNIKYSGKSSSYFSPGRWREGARSSHAAQIHTRKERTVIINRCTYIQSHLISPDGFWRHCCF